MCWDLEAHLSAQTFVISRSRWAVLFRSEVPGVRFGENDNALSGNLVLLEKLSENDLGFSERVDIGSVKRLRNRESAFTPG
jgi:hypothetical protein